MISEYIKLSFFVYFLHDTESEHGVVNLQIVTTSAATAEEPHWRQQLGGGAIFNKQYNETNYKFG